MKLIKNTLLASLSLLFISCGENTQIPIADLASIKINELNSTIYSTEDANASNNFSATAYFTDGSTKNVTTLVKWFSSDTTMATVSNGIVSAGTTNGGISFVNASYEDKISESSTIYVKKLIDYNISMIDADANTTGIYYLLASGTFEDNTTRTIVKNIVWDTNNSAIVTGAGSTTAIQIVLPGDTNITSTLFNDVNMSRTIIYSAN